MEPRGTTLVGGASDTVLRVMARGTSAPFDGKEQEGSFLAGAPVPRNDVWAALEELGPERPTRAVFNEVWSHLSRAHWQRRKGWSKRMNPALTDEGTFAWNLRLMRQIPKADEEDEDVDLSGDKLTRGQLERLTAVYRRTIRRLCLETPKPMRNILFTHEIQQLVRNLASFESELIKEDALFIPLIRPELLVAGVTLLHNEERSVAFLKLVAPLDDVERPEDLLEPFTARKEGLSDGIPTDMGFFDQVRGLVADYIKNNTPWIDVSRAALPAQSA